MKCKYIKDALNFFADSDKFHRFEQQYSENRLFLNKQFDVQYSQKRILALYDFADSPYTADIAVFIVNAEIERRRYSLDKIDIVFITNEKYPCNPTYQVIDNFKQLTYNFAIEFTRLFDFIGSVILLDNRNLARDFIKSTEDNYFLFPQDYDVNFPFERLIDLKTATYYPTNYSKFANLDISLKCISAPIDQKRLATKWLHKYCYPNIPITITLRETEKIEPKRTNNKKEWQRLINSYSSNFTFIILRDYYKLYDEDEPFVGDNVIYCNEAVISLSFRTAILELATLNLMIANGTSIVSLLSRKINYIQFKAVTNYPGSIGLDFYKKYYDFNKGDSWFLSTKYQKFVWEDDNFEVLKRETDSMLKLLEDDEKLYPDCYNKDFDYTKVEKLDIKHEVYQQPSLISQRTPLKYYVFVFKILKFIKSIFKIGKYKSIYDIDIKQNDRLVLYGAGTITKNLIQKYKDNIIGVVDKSYDTIENKMIEQISISSVESLKELTYDYIVVTPQWREYSIIDELKTKFHIRNSKFLLGSKYD